MNADRRTAVLAYVALPGTLALSTGCQAISTIFETGVWVGAIMVLLILGLVAWVVSKFRGGGGAPRGTINLLLGVVLTTTVLSAAPAPDRDSQAAPRPQGGPPEVEDVLLQGCLARDEGPQPGGRSAVERGDRAAAGSATAADRGELFLLRQASRIAAAVTNQPSSDTSTAAQKGQMYRLVPGSGVSLTTHDRQQVEVRGRLVARNDPTATAPTSSMTSPRDSQAVQGGQMQAVGQTMAPGQGGQSGQSTAAPPPDAAAARGVVDGSTGDQPPTVIVTSLRMLAPTCPSQR